MKKRLLVLFLAIVSCISLAFGLSACNKKHEHDWLPTCVEDGDKHYQICSGCSEKKYSEHSYNELGYCVCGKIDLSGIGGGGGQGGNGGEQGGDGHVHALVHHEAVEADCTKAGNVEYWSCAECKKNFSDENGKTELPVVTIKPTGHSYTDEWNSNYRYHYRMCAAGHAVTETEDEHIFKGNVCAVCGYQKSSGGGSSGLPSDGPYYEPSKIFSAGSWNMVGAYTKGNSDTDKAYVGFRFQENESKVYYRRSLAYKWYEGDSAQAGENISAPGKAVYFSMRFSFPSVRFERFTIRFESDEYISRDGKAVNEISFALTKENLMSVCVQPAGDGTMYTRTIKQENMIDWTGDFTLSFQEGQKTGEFGLSLVYSDGENTIDYFSNPEDCEMFCFKNIGGNYAEYRHTSASKPNTPITFITEFPVYDEWEEEYEEPKTQVVLVKELNGQSLEVMHGSIEENDYMENGVFIVRGGGVKDTKAPALVLDRCVYSFTIGQRYNLTHHAVDVLDDSVTVTRRYYVARKDENGSYIKPIYQEDYEVLTTSVSFDCDDESVDTMYLSIIFELEDGRHRENGERDLIPLTWYADGSAVETKDGFDYLIATRRTQSGDGAEPDENAFVFKKTEGGYAIEYYNGLSKNVVIPASYHGEPVVAIEAYAFSERSDITNVSIPACITRIGRNAFYGCSELTGVYITDLSAWCSIEFYSNPLSYAHNLYVNGELLTELTVPSDVTQIGDSAFSGCEGLTSVVIPDSVKVLGDSAFWNCSGLTSVTIGSGVTMIGENAFSGCKGLTNVVIPDSVTVIGSSAFWNCNGLTSVVIPDSVTVIGDRAFGGCSGLTSVVIPDSVTVIGDSAFFGCSGLTNVTLGSGVTVIEHDAFYSCYCLVEVINLSALPLAVGSRDYGYIAYYAKNVLAQKSDGKLTTDINGFIIYDGDTLMGYVGNQTNITVPNGIKVIHSYAFGNRKELTSVVIPNGVTTIGERAFWNCNGLTSVVIPDSVTTIGDYAFSGCSGLTSVVIPSSVTMIGENAFSGCEGLTNVVIPDSVTTIGERAFWYCSGLTSVTIGNGVTMIGERAFWYCSGLTSVVIPDSVTSIGSYAFDGCSGLTGVTIGNSVTSIGSSAFDGCSGLTSVVIPDGVTSIGISAFSDCSGLTSVTIGNSVTVIGSNAFWNCNGLTSVTIPNSVTSIGSYAFSGCSGLTSVNYTNDLAGWCKITGLGNLMGNGRKLFIDGREITGELVIPNGVTTIESYAFYTCGGLTSVVIPDSVTVIGSEAFSGCSELTSVTIGDGVKHIGMRAFYQCKKLTNVIFGSSVESIGSFAFFECGLISVTLPDSVISIGNGAFELNAKLISVSFGKNVKYIGDFAFCGCCLKTISAIPQSIVVIGKQAFAYIGLIESITYEGTVAQWEKLYKGVDWDLYAGNYTIYCTDGSIFPDGTVTKN